MNKRTIMAAGQDLSGGFKDFFDTIGMTGSGLVTKGIAAVLAVIAIRMLLTLSGDPKRAMRQSATAVGAAFVAVVLALYGSTLFATVTNAKG
ncbi:hypothetical protein AB0M94_39495 [Streptomyces xanthochromogenes]|uniref:hypothetical protein n=1 Tax=Streptomyces xanthochromogenes TaxID=67384 RepID=UPI003418A1AB